MLSVTVLIFLSGAVCTSATTLSHDLHYIYECYESDGVRVDVVVDDDVVGYADFDKKEVVVVIPHPPQRLDRFKKEIYDIAKASNAFCHSVLNKAKEADPGTLIPQEAPDVVLYTRYEGEDGVVNTLFCLANHFYPPTINFTWTKNDVEVTEGVSNLRYRHNSDGTFHRISALSITPRQGDVYSCKVEHQASQPSTRTWELKEMKWNASRSAVFFVVSIIMCFVGIGIRFFMKIKQRK